MAGKKTPATPTPAKKRGLGKGAGAAPAKKAKATAPKPPKPETPADRFRAWAKRPEAIGELCSYIVVNGTKGHLAAFCAEHSFAYNTALDWINRDADRAAMYARAREDRSDTLAERLVSLTEDADVSMPVLDDNGKVVGTIVDKGKVALLKIQADNLKWVASKLKPKVYGEKIDVNAKIDTNSLSDDELARKLAGFGISVKAVTGGAHGGA